MSFYQMGGFTLATFMLKIGKSRPLFVYFHYFHIPIQMTNIQLEQYKLKKRRWCTWDSNSGRQDINSENERMYQTLIGIMKSIEYIKYIVRNKATL